MATLFYQVQMRERRVIDAAHLYPCVTDLV